MHFPTFVAALLLPYAACRDATAPVGGCPTTCYGMTCLGAAALWGDGSRGTAGCELLESWGCDCDGCDCEDALDLDAIENVSDDYSCPTYEGGGLHTCDELAYFGFSCHYMETRRAMDCSGCLCEEVILDYVKGDGSCPMSCVGSNCDVHGAGYDVFSCESLESFDWVMGCDCSGCDCTPSMEEDWVGLQYNGMDCNGNGFWSIDALGDEVCGDEVSSFDFPMGNPDDGYEQRTWFTCLSCPELECDMGDCGEEACGRDGSTCALPLDVLCADEDSVHTPTQYGRAQYCTEEALADWAAAQAATEAATEAVTEATTVAAEDDGVSGTAATAAGLLSLLLLSSN